MSAKSQRWIARLTPAPQLTVGNLIELLQGVDVWERHADSLVVAASDLQLLEIEARHLAKVERLYTVSDFLSRR